MNCYEGNHVIPRRRRSLESVNFEDATLPGGSGFDSQELVLPPPQQLKLAGSVASKVLQGCKDYLVSNVKCNASCDQPERKVQNSDTADSLTLEAQRKVNAIVAGLGVRERRNSFRQAVGTSREGEVKLNGKSREYEAIWPSGNIVAPPLDSSVQIQGNASSGSYVNVISINGSTPGPDLTRYQLQQTKGKSCNWFRTQHPQGSVGDKVQESEERKYAPFSSRLMNGSVSQIKGLPRERLDPAQNINMYVKVDSSNVRLGKLGAQPKHVIRSKMLSPDRMGLHHNHMGTDPKLCPNKSRNLKNVPNSKSVNFKALSTQENSLQTAVDQELRTCPKAGMTAVEGKIPAREVSYKCSASSVPCHRNAAGLVVNHGPSPRMGNAVQSQYKSVEAISRPTEVNSHTAAPFTQPKKQRSMQEVSYGMYCMFTSRIRLTLTCMSNVLSVPYQEVTIFVIIQICRTASVV
jgi:hypothetical protein